MQNNWTKLFILSVLCSPNVLAYERTDFATTWSTKDKGSIVVSLNNQIQSCRLNTRSLLLSKKAETMRIGSNQICIALTGQWSDFYTNERLVLASNIGIDHVVAVSDAWESGASNWSKEKRVKYYNDIDNLVITNEKLNISKSDSSPDQWDYSFKNDNLKCKYLEKYVDVKIKYQLSFAEDDIDYLEDFASKDVCPMYSVFEYGMFGKSVRSGILVR